MYALPLTVALTLLLEDDEEAFVTLPSAEVNAVLCTNGFGA
jgi:hypothetical protein